MVVIRNILNIKTKTSPYELNYTNCNSSNNSIELIISVNSLVNPYLEFTLTNGTIVTTEILTIINNTITYDIPFEYYSTTGTLVMKILADEYESKSIEFIVSKDLNNTDNVIVKITNGQYYIKAITQGGSGGISYETKEYNLKQYINPNLTNVVFTRTRCVNKFNRIVIDFVLTGISVSANTNLILFTLPDELKSTLSSEFGVFANDGTTQITGFGYINANTKAVTINLPKTLSSSGYIRCSIIYDL